MSRVMDHPRNFVSQTNIDTSQIFKRSLFTCAIPNSRCVVVVGKRVTKSSATISAAIFDIDTCLYSDLPDIPCAISCEGAIIYDFLYVVSFDKIHRISLSKPSSWEPVHHRVVKEPVHSVLSREDFLFIFNQHGTNLVYDTRENECTIMSPMKTLRVGFASVVIQNKIFIIGGYGYFSCRNLASVEVYDISKRSWSEAPPLPRELGSSAATAIKTWIVVTGGDYDDGNLSPQSFLFETLTNKWTTHKFGLSTPRTNHCCIEIGERDIICTGGQDIDEEFCSTEVISRRCLIPSWDVIKHFVLLRKLVDENRASPTMRKKLKREKYAGMNANVNINTLLQILMTDTDWDILREILSFLI